MAKLKKVPGALVWYKGDLYVITKRENITLPDWEGEPLDSRWDILELSPVTGNKSYDDRYAHEVRLLKEPADGA